MTKDYTAIIKLLTTLTDLPITLHLTNGQNYYFEKGVEVKRPIESSFPTNFSPYQNEGNTPEVYITPELERFIFINLTPFLNARLVIGPFLTAPLPKQTLTNLLTNVSIHNYDRRLTYYQTLPTLVYIKQVALMQLIHQLLFDDTLNTSDIRLTDCWLQTNSPQSDSHKKAAAEELHRPQNRSLSMEKHYLALIEQGKKDHLKLLLNQGPLFLADNVGILALKNVLRHYKNIGIAAVSLATRSAINGGLYSERAFELSDSFIQQLEACRSIPDADKTIKEALLHFTNEVSLCGQQHSSPHVTRVLHYLKSNLYNDVTINELAADLHLSPSYLATCFKRELGVPILTHLHQLRIAEAKLLIAAKQDSLLAIAQRLKFHDQSHFTRIFKQQTGMTPRAYLTEIQR